MVMVRVLMVLVALSACTIAEQQFRDRPLNRTRSSAGEGPRQQARDYVDVLGAIDLSSTVNSYLAAGEIRYYVLHLDPHQVADFSIEYDGPNSDLYIYQGGTTNMYTIHGNTTQSTLAGHCMEYAAKYYFHLGAITAQATSFTLFINKRSSDHVAEASVYSGTVQFLDYGNIGFPITEQCQQLVFDVTLTRSAVSSILQLSYQCQSYNYYCHDVGLPQSIYEGHDTPQSHYQFFINCSTPGTYYLNMYTASSTTYNVTVSTGYPCPTGCWKGGLCDLTNGKCICRDGFQGADCSIPSAGPVATVVEIPADGITRNVSSDSQSVNIVFRLKFTPSPTQTVRVKFFVDLAGDSVYKFIYYNLGSYAAPDNYTAYSQLFGTDTNVSIEVQLCASSGPWYFYVESLSAQDLLITADMVNIAIISGSSFSYSVPASQSSLVPVVYMFRPTASSVTIQVNETHPLLQGIYLYDTCRIFAEASTNFYQIETDDEFGYGQYQISSASLSTTRDYYFVVSATPGANFTAALSYNSPGKCTGRTPFCSGIARGFCTPGSFCICRKGYSGASCSNVSLPAGYIQLQSQQTTTLHLSGGVFYDSIIYAAAPIIPTGYAMTMTVTSTTDAWVFIDNKFPVATPLSEASMTLTSRTPTLRSDLDKCVVRAPTQWYAAFVASSQVAGDVNVTFTLTQATLPSDGTTTSLALRDGYSYYEARLPTACNSTYYVMVVGSVRAVHVGEGRGSCRSESNLYLESIGNDTLAGEVLITNCTNVIDIELDLTADSVVNVTISPSTPCRNNCNGEGKCILGGKCLCNYPFYGADCGTLDTVCTVIPDNSVCKSNAPSIVSTDLTEDISNSYCQVQYEAFSVAEHVRAVASGLINPMDQWSINCQLELNQILCDSIKFKCQTQVGGGVKMMLPCNSLSWVQRCGDQYQYGGGGSAYLNNVISDVNNRLQKYPGLFICNPNPFNTSVYVTTTARPITSTITTSRPGSTTGNSATPLRVPSILFTVVMLVFFIL